MSEQIKIKKNPKKYNEYDVTMKITAGKICSIVNALKASNSPVGKDVLIMLERACEETGDDNLKSIGGG